MTETQTKPRLQGQLEWSDAKSIHIQARFDRVALHENRLVFISLVAFSQDVKAIRAGLAAGLNSPMRLKNVTLTETTSPSCRAMCGHRPRATGSTLTGSGSGRSTPSSSAASRASCPTTATTHCGRSSSKSGSRLQLQSSITLEEASLKEITLTARAYTIDEISAMPGTTSPESRFTSQNRSGTHTPSSTTLSSTTRCSRRCSQIWLLTAFRCKTSHVDPG